MANATNPAYHLLDPADDHAGDRKSTRLNSSHDQISYAVFCLKKKKKLARSCTPPAPARLPPSQATALQRAIRDACGTSALGLADNRVVAHMPNLSGWYSCIRR